MAESTAGVAPLPTPPTLGLKTFGPILAVHFLGTLGFSLAIPFLVYIVTDLGGAAWTYGLVGATYSTFQLFGAPALGRWSDRTGRRPVLLASQAGTLLAWLLFLLALSLPLTSLGTAAGATFTVPLVLVFVARALDGATGGNISVANAYVADITRDTPDVRQAAFGRMGMAASLGFVIGPAAAGLLGGTAWGPRLPIAAAAVLSLVTTVAIMVGLKEPQGRCPTGPPPGDLVESGMHQQGKPCHRAPPPKAAKGTLTQGPVLKALVGTFTIFLAFNFFFAAFPIHAATAFGWETGQLGIFFAILSGMMIVAQGPLLSFASKHLPRRVVFGVGMAFMVIALVMYQLPEGAVTYMAAACFAIGNGLSWPTFQTRVAEVGGEHQGAVQGAATSASSLASIGGLVIGGALYPVLGGSLFYLAAAMFAVVLLLTPLWFPRATDEPATA